VSPRILGSERAPHRDPCCSAWPAIPANPSTSARIIESVGNESAHHHRQCGGRDVESITGVKCASRNPKQKAARSPNETRVKNPSRSARDSSRQECGVLCAGDFGRRSPHPPDDEGHAGRGVSRAAPIATTIHTEQRPPQAGGGNAPSPRNASSAPSARRGRRKTPECSKSNHHESSVRRSV